MKLFFTRRVPDLHRMVLVESGERELVSRLLPGFYSQCPDIDLVTCYAGLPQTFHAESGRVYRVSDYPGADGRKRLYAELRARNYSAIGILCADLPIMTKWKWALAAHIPAKLFIVNENGDHFWADHSNWRIMRHFLLYRAGLSGAGAANTLGRLFVFPVTVLFLVLYTAYVHMKRKVNLLRQGASQPAYIPKKGANA